MPKADTEHTTAPPGAPAIPSRRGLLAGGTAALLAGAAIATAAHGASVASPGGAGDDAELIAVCQDFHAADAVVAALDASDAEDDAIAEPVHERWYSALERLTAIQAQTPAGTNAKAHAAYVALKSTEPGMGLQREEAAALAALADLLERASA